MHDYNNKDNSIASIENFILSISLIPSKDCLEEFSTKHTAHALFILNFTIRLIVL